MVGSASRGSGPINHRIFSFHRKFSGCGSSVGMIMVQFEDSLRQRSEVQISIRSSYSEKIFYENTLLTLEACIKGLQRGILGKFVLLQYSLILKSIFYHKSSFSSK